MMQHILIGLDGSEYNESVLQYGLWCAQSFHSALHGLHVVDIVQVESPLLHDLAGAIGAAPLYNLTTQMRQNLTLRGEQLLQQFRQACANAQVTAVPHLVTGVVPTEILSLAENMDLVILGRGGLHTGLSKSLLGSVTETVTRRSGKPVLVTPLQYYLPHKPLLATDGSPSAQAALHYAAGFVKALNVPLQVLHCTAEASSGQEILQEAQARLIELGVTCQTELYVGKVPEGLVEYMLAHGHDILFMGAFGHTRIVEWVLGSTTQYLLRTCPGLLMLCHVTSLPTSTPQTQEAAS
jgi:nucleotide-binding universal stress UspA family protein